MDWNATGTIVSAIGTIVTFFLALTVYRADNRAREKEEHARKPRLNFINNEGNWILMNVGGSTANRIRFSEKGKGEWQKAIIAYSIPSNLCIILDQVGPYGADESPARIIKYGDALVATYEDLDNKKYMVLCQGDTNHIFEHGQVGWDKSLYDHCEKKPDRRDDLKMSSIDTI